MNECLALFSPSSSSQSLGTFCIVEHDDGDDVAMGRGAFLRAEKGRMIYFGVFLCVLHVVFPSRACVCGPAA